MRLLRVVESERANTKAFGLPVAAAFDGDIALQQQEEVGIQFPFDDAVGQRLLYDAASKGLRAQPRQCSEKTCGLASVFEPQQVFVQRRGALFALRAFGFVARQQQSCFHARQVGCHHQILGFNGEVQAFGVRDKVEILLGKRCNRDVLQIDTLLPSQAQQEI